MWTKMVGNFIKNCIQFWVSVRREVGSAGEQPASNKIDAYTVIKSSQQWLLFSLSPVSCMAKKLICDCF